MSGRIENEAEGGGGDQGGTKSSFSFFFGNQRDGRHKLWKFVCLEKQTFSLDKECSQNMALQRQVLHRSRRKAKVLAFSMSFVEMHANLTKGRYPCETAEGVCSLTYSVPCTVKVFKFFENTNKEALEI